MSEKTNENDFLPKYEAARIAVARARQIVKENNEMISKLKSASNIEDPETYEQQSLDAEIFSHHDSYAFDLYKIKSSNSMKDFIKDMFGV